MSPFVNACITPVPKVAICNSVTPRSGRPVVYQRHGPLTRPPADTASPGDYLSLHLRRHVHAGLLRVGLADVQQVAPGLRPHVTCDGDTVHTVRDGRTVVYSLSNSCHSIVSGLDVSRFSITGL